MKDEKIVQDAELIPRHKSSSPRSDEALQKASDPSNAEALNLAPRLLTGPDKEALQKTANAKNIEFPAPPPGFHTSSNNLITTQVDVPNSRNQKNTSQNLEPLAEARPPTLYRRLNPDIAITADEDEDTVFERRGRRRPSLLIRFHNVSDDIITQPTGSRTTRTSTNAIVGVPARARSTTHERTSDFNPGQSYHYGSSSQPNRGSRGLNTSAL